MKNKLILIVGLGLILSYCTEPEKPSVDNLPDDKPSLEKPKEEEEQIVLSFSKSKSMPTPGRKRAFSFAIDNKIYVGTGFGTDESGQKYFSDFWEYDIQNDTWEEKAPFPLGPFSDGDAISYNGIGYVLFGKKIVCEQIDTPCNHIDVGEVHAYDPSTDTWEKVADFSDQPRLIGGHATLIGDKVFFVNNFDAYTINLIDFSYTSLANPPDFINDATHFMIEENIFLIMGMNSGIGKKDCFTYNIPSDQWQVLPDFPEVGRYGSVGFANEGMGYVLGGKQGDISGQNEQFKDIWQYNPTTTEWKKVGTYPGEAYSWKVLQKAGGAIYVGLGDKRNFLTFENDWWKLEMK
ncbi:MAG: Kelch repeat-containing protein [Cecembia sp.]